MLTGGCLNGILRAAWYGHGLEGMDRKSIEELMSHNEGCLVWI